VLYRQGDINFIVNREPRSVASYFAAEHGPVGLRPGVPGEEFALAYERALELGAQPVECAPARWNCTCRRSRASAARRCT
jgi:4-hydroxyphenylpyruvate dioxygenase